MWPTSPGPEFVELILESSPVEICGSAFCDDAFWQDANLGDVRDELVTGASVSGVNDEGVSPVHLAAKHSSPEIVELLLDHGAEVNARVRSPGDDFWESDGATPLHLAVQYNADPRVTEALLERGADIRLQSANWASPLDLASESHPAVFALLLERFPDENKSEMLRRAALSDNIPVARLLLEHVANVNYRLDDNNTATPLHGAVYASPEMARLLLEKGADPAAKNSLGMTPLHYVALERRIKPDGAKEIMAALLEYGADINAIDNASGATPLHYAVYFKEIEPVSLLLNNGADVNARDSHGDTPLLHAVPISGTVAVLLEWGAEVNVAGTNGYFPLHRAIVYDSGDVARSLELLFQHGAEIEAKDNMGHTPLHKAARWYYPEAVVSLLERGADTQALDLESNTPCQIAMQVDIVGSEAIQRLDEVRRLLTCH